MEDLERMAIFARVVEDKSFSAAARRLNLSKSLVSKQITQLESSVGVLQPAGRVEAARLERRYLGSRIRQLAGKR